MLLLSLLLLLGGCRVKDRARESELYNRIAAGGRAQRSQPGKIAALGRDAITAECAHESYAMASKGLIVGEVGLHEDVFALRDRASLAGIAYNLDEGLILESMLDAEAKAAGHSENQVACIEEFAEHLGGLTDTLIQADKVQKELDISAFNNSSKEATDQIEQMQPGLR